MALDEEVLIESDEETVTLEANDDREASVVTLDDTVADDGAREEADSMGGEDEECNVGNARAALLVRSWTALGDDSISSDGDSESGMDRGSADS